MSKIDVTLSVPDVDCAHCVATINKTLGEVAGVSGVDVSLPAKTVTFNYDPSEVSLNKIEELLDDAGYPVSK